MLDTLKATLLPGGRLDFEEEIELDRPISVLVTLLEERRPGKLDDNEDNPLDWKLSAEEKAVWDDFSGFRDRQPVAFASLKGEE